MTNWTNVLIGAAVIALVVYYLRPSTAEGFEDLASGGLIGLIVFIIFIVLAFFAIFTSK